MLESIEARTDFNVKRDGEEGRMEYDDGEYDFKPGETNTDDPTYELPDDFDMGLVGE